MEAISTQRKPHPGGLSSPDDIERFRAVLFATHEDVTRYCQRRLAAGRVDDTVAEVFAAVWQGLERVPMGTEARPWVFGIARNKVAESHRWHTRSTQLTRLLHPDPTRVSDHDRIDEQLEARSDLAEVEAAAQTLGADDVELLRLLAWERLTSNEIAIALGCSTNAAKIRIHRMRRRLSSALKKVQAGGIPVAEQGRTGGLTSTPQPLSKGTDQ